MHGSARNLALLFFACLAFHSLGTWTLPLVDRDEPRFAEASREMRQRGDYVVPYFNNQYRFDKPPLTYWAQILSYRVFGENDFAARFPSVVAAAMVAVVLLVWGRRLGAERVGWCAAIIFTGCVQVAMHARAAVADMWLVLFVTMAHWAGCELLRDRLRGNEAQPTKRWWWIFYLSLGCAFLAKGPIGWAPLLTLLATKFALRDVRLNQRFLFATGLGLTCAMVAVWGIPALEQTNGEFLRVGIGRHVVARSMVAMEGHGGSSILAYLATLPFYFVAIFISFAPWSIKLPALARKLWRKRDPVDIYLLAGVAVVFVIFTLVKTKLPHYTLPAFPLLALLLAKSLESTHFVRRAAIGFAVFVFLFAAAAPFLAARFPAYDLIRQARGDLTRPMEFGAIAYREPSLVWYARKYVDGFMSDLDEQSVREFMEKTGPRFVVLPSALAASIYAPLPAGWKSYSTHGVSTVTGRWVELTLLLKPS